MRVSIKLHILYTVTTDSNSRVEGVQKGVTHFIQQRVAIRCYLHVAGNLTPTPYTQQNYYLQLFARLR